ncbi:MAG: segregation/condensation protein A [Clostridia bacterium]|nr:segregation/condensation protein A [Clostridia bacterium]
MEKLTVDSVKNFETDVDYTTVLDNFEGPLDLLLHLIKEEEIEIKDIFVSQVTEQFLSYMKGLPYIDVDKASEYLNIAATIIDIKARSLVPPPDDDWGDEWGQDDYDDPKQDLMRALEEYKMIKEEAEKLKEMETVGYYFKEPDKELNNVQIKYKDLTMDGLLKAFAKMMLKREGMKESRNAPREIAKDKYTVTEKIKHIREQIKTRESLQFEELFSEESSTPEIVTTFQALLELLKHQFITVEQEEIFSSIIIKKNSERSEDEEIGEIDEYN